MKNTKIPKKIHNGGAPRQYAISIWVNEKRPSEIWIRQGYVNNHAIKASLDDYIEFAYKNYAHEDEWVLYWQVL